MFHRSIRAETRSRAKEDIKRIANAIERGRKWEKRWVPIPDTTMKVYRWVPATEQQKVTLKKKAVIDGQRTVPLPFEDSQSQPGDPGCEPAPSIPKHMLSYINDETSQDSISSFTNNDSLNGDESRDSNNYTPVSSISPANNDDSNAMSGSFTGNPDEDSRPETLGSADKGEDDSISEPPPSKKQKSSQDTPDHAQESNDE